MLMRLLPGCVGVALVGLGAATCLSGSTPSPVPRPRAIAPRRVATGEFSVAIPRRRGWSAGGWSNGVSTPRQEFPPC
jgi:hypothetical protein